MSRYRRPERVLVPIPRNWKQLVRSMTDEQLAVAQAVFADLSIRNVYANPERVISAIMRPRSGEAMERARKRKRREKEEEDEDSEEYRRTLFGYPPTGPDKPAARYDSRSGDIHYDDDDDRAIRRRRRRLCKGRTRS